MDKRLELRTKEYARYCGFSAEEVERILTSASAEKKVDEVERSTENPLLDVIYSIDERTGFPSGDYVMFLSNKTSPEVRAFIQNNLLSENFSQGVEVGQDTELFRYIREKGETLSEYVSRVNSMARDDYKKLVEKSKK